MSRGGLQACAKSALRNDDPTLMFGGRAAGGTGASLSARCAGPVGTRPPARGRDGHQRADGEGARARAGWLRGQDPLRMHTPGDRVDSE